MLRNLFRPRECPGCRQRQHKVDAPRGLLARLASEHEMLSTLRDFVVIALVLAIALLAECAWYAAWPFVRLWEIASGRKCTRFHEPWFLPDLDELEEW